MTRPHLVHRALGQVISGQNVVSLSAERSKRHLNSEVVASTLEDAMRKVEEAAEHLMAVERRCGRIELPSDVEWPEGA